MIQGSLQADISNPPVSVHTAQTDSVRTEFLRCRSQTTVKWDVIRSQFSLVLARNGTGEIRVRTGGSARRARPGKAGVWFIPEGTDCEGKMTADAAYDCAGAGRSSSSSSRCADQRHLLPR